MKHNRFLAFPLAAAMAFTLSVGTVGCMISGFRLPIADGDRLTLICAAAALLGSFLYLWRWGGLAVTAGLAGLSVYLWQQGTAGAAIFDLINHVSHVYDAAYGCGVFAPTDSLTFADLPMALIALLSALAVARPVCRGRGTLIALAACILPLVTCIVVTDTVPEIPYLLAWLVGLLLLILTAGVRQEDNVQGNRLLLMLALPVLLAAGTLFRLNPQYDYVNQSKEIQASLLSMLEELPQKAESAVDALSSQMQSQEQDSVDLKTLGRRQQLTYPVMEVTSDTGGVLYLRGQDYDSYTGTGWSASRFRAEDFGCAGSAAGSVTVRTWMGKDFLYLPYYPAQTQTLTGGLLPNGEAVREYTWELLQPHEAQESETVSSRIELTDLDVLAFGSTAERLRYVTLPGGTDLRAQEILEAILPENASREEQALAIADYVRGSARYDLNTGRMPEESADFALWFLSESDSGYCVHFATAAVVLLRAADIPARYVTGYMLLAQPGETVTVTAANAHAWAEYFCNGRWIPLETTPAEALYIPDADASVETDAPTPVPETEGEQAVPEETIPGDAPETVPNTIPTEETAAPEQPEDRGDLRWLRWIILILLVIGQYPLRLKLHRMLRHYGAPNRQALTRWQETQLLGKLRKASAPETLHRLAQKAKFSQHTLTEEELAQFEAYRAETVQWMQGRGLHWQILYRLVFAIY